MAVEHGIVWLIYDCVLGVGFGDDRLSFAAVAFTEDGEEIAVREFMGAGRCDDCGLGGHLIVGWSRWLAGGVGNWNDRNFEVAREDCVMRIEIRMAEASGQGRCGIYYIQYVHS